MRSWFWGSRSRELRWVFALAFTAVFARGLLAQQTSNPEPVAGPRSAGGPATIQTPTAGVPSIHRFWDRTNILLFSGIAVARGMDYASTRNFQARGREEILLPDAVVDNSAGFASLEAAGVVTSVGVSYILHRSGHHKLERWMSIGHISVTAFGDVRNYCLKTKHRQ